ncbi:holdfast anchoring protein HfaA [Maricaulaceae bacterium MS644]
MMTGPCTTLTGALVAATALCGLAAAQESHPSDWTRPYGQAHGEETRPFSGARTRAGNRVVINGIIQTGVGVSAQASAYGSVQAGGGVQGEGGYYGPFANANANASAIGNQLNVVVNGNYNTVVVNSNQTNTGNVTANAGANTNGESASEGDDAQD